MNTIIALLAGLMISFIANTFYFVIEIILITENLLPTDPLKGLLDVNTELFVAYLPYINCFMSFMRKYWLEMSLEKIKID